MKKRLYVIGIGPGSEDLLTIRAKKAIEGSDIIIGYKFYIGLIEDLCEGKKVLSSGMTKETDRCKAAIDAAEAGGNVALISGGDAGIYGMAGPLLEFAGTGSSEIDIEIIPAVSANNAAAALLGAPIMHDNCSISLSDRLTPWELIEKRLTLAAEGDFVVSLYNPKSKGRPDYINKAQEIFLKFRAHETLVGIVKNAEREGESAVITSLKDMLEYDIDMFTVIIIGNKNTKRSGKWMVTPRGYEI